MKWKLGFNEKRILAAEDQDLMKTVLKKMAKINQNNQCHRCHSAVECNSVLTTKFQIMLADTHYTTIK